MDTKPVKITPPDKGKAISLVGDTYRILISGEDTGGYYAAIDMLIPPKGGPGPHSHFDIHESFFVIEGVVEVYSEGSDSYTARQGAFISIPKGGIVHSFKNESDSIAHLLCYVAPSGMENFFAEAGEPVRWGDFKSPTEMTPEKKNKLKKLAEKHRQKLFPSDFFEK
jgi:quercetin dioxygenase-like cupin family protein